MKQILVSRNALTGIFVVASYNFILCNLHGQGKGVLV